ncbi:MAG TPA: NAD-dependent epimerase/dehydratase family protein [Acidimicrobiales bacterium]|jgi:nucleoside-diphosphate-sugar epimerase|nr:NAD-dependent epimerase/dehydratase family protein [Acidimicrobiales bacterium]
MSEVSGNLPTRALVTGAAGFIGSHLAERLVDLGVSVVGVDALTDYYERTAKQSNLVRLLDEPKFEFVEHDLMTVELRDLLDGVDVVFHQAAQPGVRLSWADGFSNYSERNINVTQRLLEAVRSHPVERFVFASSSSVYGLAEHYPTEETAEPRPYSPYGVTKYAAELLCRAYAANFGVSTVSLRYFTVYGPRQRPDMAIHRLIEAARNGRPFPLYGSGDQIRDFTFVSDVVEANVRAGVSQTPPGSYVNIAGGSSTRLLDLIALVGEIVGREVLIERLPAAPGDVRQTGGSIEAARRLLGWSPVVELRDGVRAQVMWHEAAIVAGHPITYST